MIVMVSDTHVHTNSYVPVLEMRLIEVNVGELKTNL
jgi:hypothetical protein